MNDIGTMLSEMSKGKNDALLRSIPDEEQGLVWECRVKIEGRVIETKRLTPKMAVIACFAQYLNSKN